MTNKFVALQDDYIIVRDPETEEPEEDEKTEQ